jgi:hypothetical protein
VAVRFASSSRVKNDLPRYSNFWDGTTIYSPFTATGSYDALATYTVPSGGVNTITFSGLPTGGQYSHLQIRGIVKNNRTAAGTSNININFNNDSTTTYSAHILFGNGANPLVNASSSQTTMTSAFGIGTASGYGSIFTPMVIDILDYASITKNKTMRVLFGTSSNNDQLDVGLGSGLYYKTDAINSISITSPSTPLQQFSQFSVYGIRG